MKFTVKNPNSPYIPMIMTGGARATRDRQATISKHQQSLNHCSYGQFASIFAKILPEDLFNPLLNGSHSRIRLLSLKLTFYLGIHQIFLGNVSCQKMVIHAQAWLSSLKGRAVSLTSSAYCQARRHLPLLWLAQIGQTLIHNWHLTLKPDPRHLGLRVLVVDGTCFALPDTPANAAQYPYPAGQKPGCGFPIMPVVALFSLASGALVDWIKVTHLISECRFFANLWGRLKPGDLILGDRAYGSFFNITGLAARQVHYLGRLHQKRPFPGAHRQRLGHHDYLVTWAKPAKPRHHTLAEWQLVPSTLELRLMQFQVTTPGFRTQQVIICTTLLDPTQYPAEALAVLYGLRWQVELDFRDIKTTMGMDHLACRSPAMIDREFLFLTISYNLVRWLIHEDAVTHDRQISSYSFSNSLAHVSIWAVKLSQDMSMSECARWHQDFRDTFGDFRHTQRLGRSEPRALKRRPKSFKLMNRPRREMIVEAHRNRYKAPSTAQTGTPAIAQQIGLT